MTTTSCPSRGSLLSKLILVALLVVLTSGCVNLEAPGRFGIYTVSLRGGDLKPIATDSFREINHARVSPDKQWITFTRYNKRSLNGLAEEIGGYRETEIMLMRLDGSDMTSLTDTREFQMAANGYWSPDGKSIIFVGKKTSDTFSRIYLVEVKTRKVKELPAIPGENLADPHIIGSQVVFTSREEKPKTRNVICLMKLDGSGARKLTNPKLHNQSPPEPPEGDFDPKLSPDGLKAAFMRHDGKSWRLVVFDLKTGREQDLSRDMDGDADAVPEWSSDGKLLSFWHVNLKHPQKSGLYTMKPDGSERKRIRLPEGYFYTMQAFFPDEGSGPDARIIFSAKKL